MTESKDNTNLEAQLLALEIDFSRLWDENKTMKDRLARLERTAPLSIVEGLQIRHDINLLISNHQKPWYIKLIERLGCGKYFKIDGIRGKYGILPPDDAGSSDLLDLE